MSFHKPTRLHPLAPVAAFALLITACSSDSSASGEDVPLTPEAAAAVADYKSYVTQQANDLVTRTSAFTDAVIAGDVNKAKALYATTRAPYERIEPVAESFGDLDPAIDARADETPVEKIEGFHRIEHALWVNSSTADMTPVARKLLEDVNKLRSEVATLDIDPTTIAGGAGELLNEVSHSKITGEEERYSHTDVWDIDANVAGSKAAIAAVRPLLDKANASLGTAIDERFKSVDADVAAMRSGDGFVLYTDLTEEQKKTLSQHVDAVAEPASQVAGEVAPAE